MAEPEEECELQQLVPCEEDRRSGDRYGEGEVTPPVSPAVSKLSQTSVTNVNVSSTGSHKDRSSPGGAHGNSPAAGMTSLRAPASHASSSSRSLSRIATVPSINSNTGGSGTRLSYVNEKMNTRPQKSSQGSLSRPHMKRVNTAPLDRSIHHHCFLSDVTDVRRMETALLHLLEDFHSGKLRAFGKDCSMEQMTGIREQQESLAKLHFELGAQQELFAPLSAEGLSQGADNMTRLMASLERLSESIEKLHSFNS
ncbi:coiled-coil domain-containing protein 28B isoform X3 [Nilaparvata lugens]|nr:coiled-coil domain-containing protein 28B isoform X3 [Nilaparvata lugens]